MTNLDHAFDYVNQRYVFNSENYPVIARLTEPEKEFFALKHGLLHMQKSILTILDAEKLCRNVASDEDYKKAILKTLVNLITMSKVVGLSSKEITQLKMEEIQLPLSNVLLKMMKEVAAQCENFDHQQVLEALDLTQMKTKEILITTWKEIQFSFKMQFQSEFSLENALTEISSVMKSV